MDVYFDDHYPADAAYGCDWLTRNAQGDILVDTPDGQVKRREKVLITSREDDYEGRICIGERTVRHLAHQLGLVDDWRVERIAADNRELRTEVIGLSVALGAARNEANRLAQLERPDATKVYVALDGTEHLSERAAVEHCAKLLDLEPAIILDAVATADPISLEVPS